MTDEPWRKALASPPKLPPAPKPRAPKEIEDSRMRSDFTVHGSISGKRLAPREVPASPPAAPGPGDQSSVPPASPILENPLRKDKTPWEPIE